MKYPLFYKDRTGHYRRIPDNLLEIFPDGKIGLSGWRHSQQSLEIIDFVHETYDMWKYEVSCDRFIFGDLT